MRLGSLYPQRAPTRARVWRGACPPVGGSRVSPFRPHQPAFTWLTDKRAAGLQPSARLQILPARTAILTSCPRAAFNKPAFAPGSIRARSRSLLAAWNRALISVKPSRPSSTLRLLPLCRCPINDTDDERDHGPQRHDFRSGPAPARCAGQLRRAGRPGCRGPGSDLGPRDLGLQGLRGQAPHQRKRLRADVGAPAEAARPPLRLAPRNSHPGRGDRRRHRRPLRRRERTGRP